MSIDIESCTLIRLHIEMTGPSMGYKTEAISRQLLGTIQRSLSLLARCSSIYSSPSVPGVHIVRQYTCEDVGHHSLCSNVPVHCSGLICVQEVV